MPAFEVRENRLAFENYSFKMSSLPRSVMCVFSVLIVGIAIFCN